MCADAAEVTSKGFDIDVISEELELIRLPRDAVQLGRELLPKDTCGSCGL